jgi:signal transduction histidine kinase
MSLLPCVRRGSDRWWLPRSGQATEAIGHLIIANSPAGIDKATRRRVLRAIESDPSLLIFTALNWTGERVGTGELVDWLAEHVTDRFASGDAFLGAPPITPEMQRGWKRLEDHFRTLPVTRWLDDAALWLEVTGPKVSAAWRQQWPEISVRSDAPTDAPEPATNCMLQQLARMTQRQRSLEDAFDRRLHQTKLGAIKELAYGLSHEINNPLANISTRAQQLQRGEDDPSRVATLQRIIDQVYRAHEMIADLMFYANPPTANLNLCEITPIVQAVIDSFEEETLRQGIRIEVTRPDEPTFVTADADMIGEALRVLIRNAVEAIGCQGTIVVSIAGTGDTTKIHIADSGPGLSEAARQHAFDPYYSGREAGRGLGLGLCRAYRIAQLHNAEITLAGGPAGCVATISIPTTNAPDRD